MSPWCPLAYTLAYITTNDRMLVACCGCLDATVAWHHQRGTAFASCECGKKSTKNLEKLNPASPSPARNACLNDHIGSPAWSQRHEQPDHGPGR